MPRPPQPPMPPSYLPFYPGTGPLCGSGRGAWYPLGGGPNVNMCSCTICTYNTTRPTPHCAPAVRTSCGASCGFPNCRTLRCQHQHSYNYHHHYNHAYDACNPYTVPTPTPIPAPIQTQHHHHYPQPPHPRPTLTPPPKSITLHIVKPLNHTPWTTNTAFDYFALHIPPSLTFAEFLTQALADLGVADADAELKKFHFVEMTKTSKNTWVKGKAWGGGEKYAGERVDGKVFGWTAARTTAVGEAVWGSVVAV